MFRWCGKKLMHGPCMGFLNWTGFWKQTIIISIHWILIKNSTRNINIVVANFLGKRNTLMKFRGQGQTCPKSDSTGVESIEPLTHLEESAHLHQMLGRSPRSISMRAHLILHHNTSPHGMTSNMIVSLSPVPHQIGVEYWSVPSSEVHTFYSLNWKKRSLNISSVGHSI